MQIIERVVPSKIIVLEAMKRRVDVSQPKHELVASLLRRAEIGYRGELKVDRLWKELTVPTNALLLHSYETRNDIGNSHQMDTLFVCPYFIYILEIKNVTGYIWYEEEKHQFLRRKLTAEVESFQSPFDQVQRHSELIERVVERLGLSLPVHKSVVIAESSTVIGAVPSEFSIFHAIGLPSEVKKLFLKYNNFGLSRSHFELLGNHLLSLHKPKVYVPRFEVPPLRKGAVCECGRGMRYNYGKFLCSCGMKSKEPLYQGLHDYRVLFGEWISNREFREFFFIESQHSASKLLKRMDLKSKGTTKDRSYLIPEGIWRK